MTRFIQFHLLISYPPSNLNRDDLGAPKSARMGGVERLRVSSQSLKRAWRTSDVFATGVTDGKILTPSVRSAFFEMLKPNLAIRSRDIGNKVIRPYLEKAALSTLTVDYWVRLLSVALGEAKLKAKQKSKKDDADEESGETEDSALVFLSDAEGVGLISLLTDIVSMELGESVTASNVISELKDIFQQAEKADTKDKRNTQLRKLNELLFSSMSTTANAVDVAMFGRMMTINPSRGVEAAVQVAHALGVHATAIDDDYFTAVDDLNSEGAGHIGEVKFAAALFYQYICIDRDQLKRNLGGDEALTQKVLKAFTEVVLTVGPSGKQNSFASRAYAHYALAEKGSRQPRSLSLAFLKPISGADYAVDAITALETVQRNMDKVYGACADACCDINVLTGKGSVADLIEFVAAESGFKE